MPRMRNEELTPRQEAFARAYVECGNATHALKQVLKQWTMKPHSLRARANGLKNDYRVCARIDELIAEKSARSEPLPHLRATTFPA